MARPSSVSLRERGATGLRGSRLRRLSPLPQSARAVQSRPGAKTFERSSVSQIQRARLIAAAAHVACEHGAGNVTVACIVERAGVSRRTFYEIFAGSEDCLLAALTDALERSRTRVLAAWRSEGSWHERTRAALVELLSLFEGDPVLAQLLVVESLAAGRRVLEERSRVLHTLIDAVNQGATQTQGGTGATRLSAEGAVGGVLGVLHARLTQPSDERLVALTGALMSMLVLPYSGPAAARRELARPAPRMAASQPQSDPPLRADPFKEAGMRLTYRTMRVLSSVAQHPGSSNRQVADLAGLSDQGQTSKLLARLERLGMIVNEGLGQSKGEPNAWMLTPAGLQVTSRIDVQPDRFVGPTR